MNLPKGAVEAAKGAVFLTHDFIDCCLKMQVSSDLASPEASKLVSCLQGTLRAAARSSRKWGGRAERRASLVAQMVKNLPEMWEAQVLSLGQENPMVKGMATHSSIFAWRILGTEEPGRLQSMGSQRVGHN